MSLERKVKTKALWGVLLRMLVVSRRWILRVREPRKGVCLLWEGMLRSREVRRDLPRKAWVMRTRMPGVI